MPKIAFLFIFFASFAVAIAQVAHASGLTCATGAATTEESITVIQDLARLYATIAESGTEASLSAQDKTFLLAEFKTKLAEAEAWIGRPIWTDVRARADAILSETPIDKIDIEKIKQNESQSFNVFKDVFKIQTDDLVTLDDRFMRPTDSACDSSGVVFSADDRFVFFRDRKHDAWLFDTRADRFLFEHDKRSGTLSVATNDFLETDRQNRTTVRDLVSGNIRGVVEGVPVFTKDHFATVAMNQETIVTFLRRNALGENIYSVSDIKSGKGIEISGNFSIANDFKTVVRQKPDPGGLFGIWNRWKPSLEIIDIDTRKVIRTIEGKATMSGYNRGYLTFERGNKNYLLRMSDLKEFEIPKLNIQMRLSPDERSVIFGSTMVSNNTDTLIYNLESQKTDTFKEYSYRGEAAKGEFFLMNHRLKKTLIFQNSETNPKEVDGAFFVASPDGRWLYFNNGGSAALFDRVSGTHLKFTTNLYDDSFLPNTGYLISRPGSPPEVFYGDINSPGAVRLGPGNSRSGRQGKYIITSSNGVLTLYRAKSDLE